MLKVTLEFDNEDDKEYFLKFVNEAKQHDHTPAPLYCGLAAGSVKRAKVSGNIEKPKPEKVEPMNKDGYNNGYTWYERFGSFPNYWPGGPFFYNDETRKENEAWRNAWKIGVRDYAVKNNLPIPACALDRD
jgi:hypothetical protein